MNFGQAIEALKDGKKVARNSWNGKNMFIYLTVGQYVSYDNLRGSANKFLNKNICGTEDAIINSHIDMKTADGSICIGWLASQTDMLAEDWVVVE